MLCMFTSVYIPGSPTGTAGIDLDQLKIGSPILILILAWVIFEGYTNVVTCVRTVDFHAIINHWRVVIATTFLIQSADINQKGGLVHFYES